MYGKKEENSFLELPMDISDVLKKVSNKCLIKAMDKLEMLCQQDEKYAKATVGELFKKVCVEYRRRQAVNN